MQEVARDLHLHLRTLDAVASALRQRSVGVSEADPLQDLILPLSRRRGERAGAGGDVVVRVCERNEKGE